jgi:ribosomal protein S18 acetylase RimI-like enzyme
MAGPVSLRPVRWPEDAAALAAIDNSYTTDRIYRVHREALAFRLEVATVNPPIHKSYGWDQADVEEVRPMKHVVVADQGGRLVSLVAAHLSEWNRRVQIERLYVAVDWRGRGIGRALVDSVVGFARASGAWCVWVETQNINYPAIQFYLRYGFRLVGLDERLYDPATQAVDETALFFALDLAT